VLEREVAIYRQLQKHGVEVSFVTYGDGRDFQFVHRIPGIRILCNRWRLPPKVYTLLLPLLQGPAFRHSDVMKTNQTIGANIALRVARFWRKPLIARCGYMWSFNAARQHGPDSDVAKQALQIETQVFKAARKIVVTAQHMVADIVGRIPSAALKTTVIPNYVDGDIFAPPDTNASRDIDVIFVGRLKPEKNIPALLEAVRPLNISTAVIGGGSSAEEAEFQRQIDGLGEHIRWLGSNLPNIELPKHLNRAKVFVLPSSYEGHPKTLIEAMACGLPVIGTDVPGIRELVRHRETGYLCGTSPAEIRAAMLDVLGDSNLRERMGHNAREFVVENFTLHRVVEMELALLNSLV
jgi:glycosyltransferase involved in cell wall biosynthesis